MAEEKKDDTAQLQAEEPSSSTSASSAPRFEIKKWNAVTMWSWDICADTCAICRNSLNEPSIEYQANPSPNNENGLSIAFGTCGHVFHLDCIQRWLKTRSVCPLCNKEWVSEIFLNAFLLLFFLFFYTLIMSTSSHFSLVDVNTLGCFRISRRLKRYLVTVFERTNDSDMML